MLFRRLAMALLLTLAVAMVGLACGMSATATPEPAAMWEEPVIPDEPDSGSYQVVGEPTSMPESESGSYRATAMPEPTAMSDSYDAYGAESTQAESSSSYTVQQYSGATTRSMSSSNSTPAPAPTAVPSATTFQDYRQSPLVAASRDRTSTFSLDTDRTSFQLALNWARNGYQIDPDSVRAEEWVNAFYYDYQKPNRQDSFAISTALVEHPLQSEMHLARITFQAPDVRDENRPLNVTLVMDASGSMREGNRVEIARTAADSIRKSLGRNDRISIVQFSTNVLHENTVESRGPDNRDVVNSLRNFRPGNSTNVQAGLNLGVRIADRMRSERPNAYNYIILMSDGVANVDATDPFAILRTAGDRQSTNPLRLITIGVGIENYNDYLLEQLAQHGNGWYRYLDNEAQARATFRRDNWTTISTPFADQTRAQVIWDPGKVDSWRLIGYENRVTTDQAFEENRREFAEIPSGTATTVFFELQLTPHAGGWSGEAVDLGDVHVRWVTPISGETRQQDADIWGYSDVRFEDSADDMLRFGAVVALASDRYGGLPYVQEEGASIVAYDLRTLETWLQYLNPNLSHLDSFNDFSFVLGQMIDTLPRYEGASGGSGYSP